MRTPLAYPSSLTLMKSSRVPWNQVACITPSSCQTVRNRSHRRAAHGSAHFPPTGRRARQSKKLLFIVFYRHLRRTVGAIHSPKKKTKHRKKANGPKTKKKTSKLHRHA